MIIFKDWTISGPMEVIARQYDNLSCVLLVTGNLPEGYTWDMLVQVGRAMDIIHLYPMEGGVGAVLTEDQLSQSGYYQMQLRGTQGDVVRHTNVIQALIPPSLSGSGQWPTVPSEFSQMEARMREIVAHPPIPGDNGCWQLWDPDTGEYAESEFPLPEGADGQDGVTPTIGDNGNWYLGDTDTGKPSRGEAGPAGADGRDGANGQPGADGKTAYQYAQDGGYTGTEEAFAEKLAQEPLIGTTNDLTPTQVYDAVSAGIPVKVQYFDNTFGGLAYTNFSVAESMNVIGANTIAYFNGAYILGELVGDISGNTWDFMTTTLAQKTDIPTVLPNPNALTFTGAVTGTYNGTNPVSIEIPSAVTDEHINSMIDTKLGVIENGSY